MCENEFGDGFRNGIGINPPSVVKWVVEWGDYGEGEMCEGSRNLLCMCGDHRHSETGHCDITLVPFRTTTEPVMDGTYLTFLVTTA